MRREGERVEIQTEHTISISTKKIPQNLSHSMPLRILFLFDLNGTETFRVPTRILEHLIHFIVLSLVVSTNWWLR